jgi:hypothetical protein
MTTFRRPQWCSQSISADVPWAAQRALSLIFPITQRDAACRRAWRLPQARRPLGLARISRAGSPKVSARFAPVSFAVSFVGARRCPPSLAGYGHPRSRTPAAGHERWGRALGKRVRATPQEFESPIPRSSDQRGCVALQGRRQSPKGDMPLAGWLVPVHYLRKDASFPQARTTHPAGARSLDAAGQMLHRAWVGDRRAARIAGSRPARAPMSMAAAMPPAHASGGMTVAQPLCRA